MVALGASGVDEDPDKMRVRGKEAIRRTTAFRSDRRPEHAGAALRIFKGSRLPQERQHPARPLQAHI